MKLVPFDSRYLITRVNPSEFYNWPTSDGCHNLINLSIRLRLPALAANQAGLPGRYVVALMHDWRIMINPTIAPITNESWIVPELDPHTLLTIAVKRFRHIHMTWQSLDGHQHEENISGILATSLQTAYNYLNGEDLATLYHLGDWGTPQVRYARD